MRKQSHSLHKQITFSIKDLFSKCDQEICGLYLLKKSLMENFICCAVIRPMSTIACFLIRPEDHIVLDHELSLTEVSQTE